MTCGAGGPEDAQRASSQVAAAAGQFGPFEGRVWLNTAHQGPLPRAAVEASHRAAWSKAAPHRLADSDFTEVPERLRGLLARLVGAEAEQVVLGDSASHGPHLVANGLAWQAGDEVLVVAGDYPATVLPWQRLAGRGVRTRTLHPSSSVLRAEAVAVAITERTRVLAVTWVDSFTGWALDLHALGAVCRAAGVLLVVNASQGLGARVLDVSSTPVDAVVWCGVQAVVRALWHRVHLAAPAPARPAPAPAGVLVGDAGRPRPGPDAQHQPAHRPRRARLRPLLTRRLR